MAVKLKENSFCRESEGLPPAGKLVVVMCWEKHHIGYRDERGKWRHATHHQELHGVMGWCALSARDW